MQRPRGTRDFGPDEAATRQLYATAIRKAFRSFSYHEVQTPTFEELELFTAKSGEGIISELYDFQDKGGRKMTLRPELTAPVMRMVYQDHAFDPKPLKWFYFGNCFRYDRPQTGRYREFWQFGCEQVGAGTPLAYAELIALGDSLFDAVGLKQRDFQVGHVGILRALVANLGLDDVGPIMRLIDKRDLDGLQTTASAAGADGSALHALLDAIQAESLQAAGVSGPHADELAAVLTALDAMGVKVRLNLGIARGLDYYNGVVFEAHAPVLGAQSQLLGGGGYDLSGIFGKEAMPTMGFGLGFDRTLVALEAQGESFAGAVGPDLVIGALSEAAQATVLDAARALRADGLAIDVDLLGRKPAQIAKYADAKGAVHLALVGDRDLEAGTVQVKNLQTGEAETIPLDFKGWRGKRQ